MKLENSIKNCGRFAFEDYQSEIKAIIERAISDYDETVAMQRHYDLIISDLMHQLEDEKMNAAELVKWAVKFKDTLHIRRIYKAKQQYLHPFAKLLKDSSYQGQLNRMFDKNLLRYDDKPYKPRVIKEEQQ